MGVFCECSSLKSLPDISKWNINNATKKDLMFYGCNGSLKIPTKFQ